MGLFGNGSGSGLVTKSCLTLVTSWTVTYQTPLSVAFSRQEYWSGLPFSSPGDLPNPEIEPGSPALQADLLLTEIGEKPLFGNRVIVVWAKPSIANHRSSCFYRGKGGSWGRLFQTVQWLPFLTGWVRQFLISRPAGGQGEVLPLSCRDS